MIHGWDIKKLGEVCEIFDSQRKPVTKKNREEGPFPYYGATGIQDYVNDYLFDGRFLLIGEDGAKWGAGDKTAFVINGKCWVNNHAHIIQTKEILETLLEYYLNFKDLTGYITGAVVPKLTQQAMRSIPIPVPPLSVQTRIVSELDLLSEVIAKKKQQLTELDNLAQAIFFDMFGDPVANDKGWETKRLGDICSKCTTGPFGSMVHQYDYTEEGGIPLVNPADIKEGFISDEKIKHVNEGKALELEKYKLELEDIVLARRGDLSKCAIVDMTNVGWLCGTGSFVLHLTEIDAQFFQRVYTSESVQRVINEASIGATMPNLNQSLLTGLRIPIPPIAVQQQFSARISALESQKSKIKESLTEAETLFNSRMSYWFD